MLLVCIPYLCPRLYVSHSPRERRLRLRLRRPRELTKPFFFPLSMLGHITLTRLARDPPVPLMAGTIVIPFFIVGVLLRYFVIVVCSVVFGPNSMRASLSDARLHRIRCFAPLLGLHVGGHISESMQPSSEQQFGLYTPPSSPPLTPTYAHAPVSTSVPIPSRRSSRGSSGGPSSSSAIIPSLFADESSDANAENDDDAMMSYTGNYYSGSPSARARSTPNELWLQRAASSSRSGVSYPAASSWMPAPSSSVNIRPTAHHRQASAGSDVGAYDARRVRFLWGTPRGHGEDDNDDDTSPSSSNRNNRHGNNNGNGNGYGGGRRGGGYGYGSGAAGSKRVWGGRDIEWDDDESEEDTVNEEQERRARRRGR